MLIPSRANFPMNRATAVPWTGLGSLVREAARRSRCWTFSRCQFVMPSSLPSDWDDEGRRHRQLLRTLGLPSTSVRVSPSRSSTYHRKRSNDRCSSGCYCVCVCIVPGNKRRHPSASQALPIDLVAVVEQKS